MGDVEKKSNKRYPTCRKVKLFFKGETILKQHVVANSKSRMHRRKLEEKASGKKEISITVEKGTEVDKGVKNWE